MNAAVAGFFTGLSLIVAIGAQNAYVLRLGLTRSYVGLAVLLCAVSDVVLIILGIAGIGRVVHWFPQALQILKWIGVAYLVGFALYSFIKARSSDVLLPADAPRSTRSIVVATTLAFTLLNPHVYLDTVLLLGSIGNQYGHGRWLFAAGACLGSILGFSGLGFGAKAAAGLMARPITWRILDVAIGVIMLLVALNLATTRIAA